MWVFLKIEAAINLLRGQIHEALGCSDAAIECYKSALQGDVYCYEALHSLTSNYMLTPKDGRFVFFCLCFDINIKPDLIDHFRKSTHPKPTHWKPMFQKGERISQIHILYKIKSSIDNFVFIYPKSVKI